MVIIVERWSDQLWKNHEDNIKVTLTAEHHFDVTTTDGVDKVIGFDLPDPQNRFGWPISYVAGLGGSLSLFHEDCFR